MNKNANFFNRIVSFLKRIFGVSSQIPFQDEVIGMGHFDNQKYFIVRQGNECFFVSDTKHRTYRQKIVLPRELIPYIHTLGQCDALSTSPHDYHLVCSFELYGVDKTLYLYSRDGKTFRAISMTTNPDHSATKLLYNSEKDELLLFTSFDGGIFYRVLNIHDREITYRPTGIFPRTDFFEYAPHSSFDHSPLSVVGVFDIPEGIFLVYDSSYHLRGHSSYVLGGALLDKNNPSHICWRTFKDELPLWKHFQSHSEKKLFLEALYATQHNNDIFVYFHDKERHDIYELNLHEPFSRKEIHHEKAFLRKYVNNPILTPNEQHNWECYATFNPAALQLGDTTHLLYRAEGSAGLSVIGYGKSNNGVTFDRFSHPIYVPRMDFEGVNISPENISNQNRTHFKSGYNHYPINNNASYRWHGVEDPRITKIDDRIYMIYCAFNGYNYARPAITSIDINDFLEQKWNWTIPQPMTEQVYQWSQGNKSVVLHPEKVHGKYLIYHRVWPHIRIDYVNDLEFGPHAKYLKEVARIEARGDSWDSNRVGVAAPPLEIDEGWLLIYQASGSQDRRYKVGAMILDKNDPSKVLYRSNQPILVPEEWYERGIAYVCGAVIRDGELHVYYGGNDKHVCLAKAPLSEFVERLKKDPYYKPQLHRYKSINELCT